MLLNINAATMHFMQPNLPRSGCRVGQFFCRIAFASQCFGKMGGSLFLPIKQQRCYCHCSSRRPTKTPTLICTDKVESWDSKRIQLTKSFSPTPRRFERSFWRSCWKRRQSCKTLAEWLTNTRCFTAIYMHLEYEVWKFHQWQNIREKLTSARTTADERPWKFQVKQKRWLTPSRTFLALAEMLVLRRSGLWRILSYISAVSRL